MANADNIKVKIEVNASDLVEACIKALTEDGTLVEVVRCKDCIYWGHHLMTKDGKRGDCMHFEVGTKADHFCAFGETMKEDGE